MKKIMVLCLLTAAFMLLCSCYPPQNPPLPPVLDAVTAPPSPSPEDVKSDVHTSPTPFDEGKLSATPAGDAQDFDAVAVSLMQRLALDMWEPYVTLTPFEIPEYVEDNAATHLALRWPDYHLAQIAEHPRWRLVSIDSIDTSVQDGQKLVGGLLTVRGMSEIRYTRVNPSVNGVNVEFHLTIDITREDPKIIAIDMVFNSNYRNMKEEIARRSDGAEPSIQLIDSVVDKAIKNLK